MANKVPMAQAYKAETGEDPAKPAPRKSKQATISGKQGVRREMVECPECGAHFSTRYE